jgi:hypothetical protein
MVPLPRNLHSASTTVGSTQCEYQGLGRSSSQNNPHIQQNMFLVDLKVFPWPDELPFRSVYVAYMQRTCSVHVGSRWSIDKIGRVKSSAGRFRIRARIHVAGNLGPADPEFPSVGSAPAGKTGGSASAVALPPDGPTAD